MDTDSKQPSPKADWMPSVAAETLKSSERQLPGGRYGRAGLNVIFWLYLGVRMTLEAKNPLMRWGFLGLWLVSGLILMARWRWEQEHPEQRSLLDFQFMWKYLAFMVIWTGLLLLVDSFYSGGQRSDLRVPLMGLLVGSFIWLSVLVYKRRTQGP